MDAVLQPHRQLEWLKQHARAIQIFGRDHGCENQTANESKIDNRKSEIVIDVGCGSGILSIAALKLGRIVANAENVIAMELLSAAQALDFHLPLAPVAGVAAAYRTIRKHVAFAEEDRVFHPDIEAIRNLMTAGELLEAVTDVTGPLET